MSIFERMRFEPFIGQLIRIKVEEKFTYHYVLTGNISGIKVSFIPPMPIMAPKKKKTSQASKLCKIALTCDSP